MNNTKICIPVCTARADELMREIKAASTIADVIEVRFDYLDPDELNTAFHLLAKAKIERPLLATFRPLEEGGNRHISLNERRTFWQQLPPIFAYADLEHDVSDIYVGSATLVVSHHDFDTREADLDRFVKGFTHGPNSILKVAKSVADAADALPIWKLFLTAQKQGISMVPVAMGEAGKWTRIMGPAYGSPLAYSKPLSGDETAAGQIEAAEMDSLYRVKEIDRETRMYGVVGDPVAGSLSPYMHNPAFRKSGINAVFIPFLVRDIGQFIARMVRSDPDEARLNFAGLSVTMPHKRTIIPLLDEIDETASEIGAVNTVKVENGRLIGSNTDAQGFIAPLKKTFGELKGAKVAVLGGGGAARACVFAMKKEGANVQVIVRNVESNRSMADDFGVTVSSRPDTGLAGFDILVNATPIGMKASQKTPFTAGELTGVKLVYDLVPRVEATALIREAEAAGIATIGGIEMLASQGSEQFRIWTGIDVSAKEMKTSLLARDRFALVG